MIYPPAKFQIMSDDFESKELGSVYCKGMIYNLRVGDGRLAKHLDQWIEDGTAKIVTGGASITGEGA